MPHVEVWRFVEYFAGEANVTSEVKLASYCGVSLDLVVRQWIYLPHQEWRSEVSMGITFCVYNFEPLNFPKKKFRVSHGSLPPLVIP